MTRSMAVAAVLGTLTGWFWPRRRDGRARGPWIESFDPPPVPPAGTSEPPPDDEPPIRIVVNPDLLDYETSGGRLPSTAARIRAQIRPCPEHLMPLPKPSCWTCGRNGAFERAARIAGDIRPSFYDTGNF